MTSEEKTLMQRCRRALKDLDSSAEVILYGSRAKGGAGPESDYDILIVTDGDAGIEREDLFRHQLYSIELETGAVLTVFLVSRKDWESPLYGAMPFYQHVKREGILI